MSDKTQESLENTEKTVQYESHNKNSTSQIEYKICNFKTTECKQIERDGVKIGLISGYAATWDLDRGNDIIQKGAFVKSLQRHRESNRKIRMHYQHNNLMLIGGFDPNKVWEDDKGLYVQDGEINLEVQCGREVYALAKQGVISDFSFGYSIQDADMNQKGSRLLKELEIWEISPVSEPMNASANVEQVKNLHNQPREEAVLTENEVKEVKAATPFRDLPLAPQDRPWDSEAAIRRVRVFTDSVEQPSDEYRDAFFRYDPQNRENFTAYSFPFADVVDGRLMAVPRGVFAAAGAVEGARGGSNLSGQERIDVVRHIERYYDKMDLESPFEPSDRGESSYMNIQDVKTITSKRILERRLRESGVFSREASKWLASQILGSQRESVDSVKSINSELSELNESIKKLLK